MRPVYPRWRGEHRYQISRHHVYGGLSPLARGTRMNVWPNEVLARFIPAGAGNTLNVTH